MPLLRWVGPALALLSSALLAVSAWPVPRHVDANLDCPKQVRLGDMDTLTLSVSPEAAEGGAVAVAHVEAPGLRLNPPGDVLQPVRPGQPLRWRWQVSAAESPGPRDLTLIIYLRPAGSPAEAIEQPIWARSLAITVTDVLGMPAAAARAIGLVGTLAGFGLSLLPLARVVRSHRQPS